MDSPAESQIIEERKKKVVAFLKSKYNLVVYFFMAIIVFISSYIRTRSIPGLKDITTGQWTLGPDLDPFLFLRYAKYIIAHGKLMALDTMRYVPMGYETSKDFLLHIYSIAWFHKIASFFGSGSVEFSAIIFPVFMFGLTVIASFLFVRKVFIKSQGIKKASLIALVSSLFISVMPSLLPRAIAGIPEKEGSAFFYMFMAFFFFLCSWDAENKRKGYLFAILAGLFTGAMALVWGGYAYVFFIMGTSVLIAFIFDKVDKQKIYSYALWILGAFLIMVPFSAKHNVKTLFNNTAHAYGTGILLILFIDLIVWSSAARKYLDKEKIKIMPPRLVSIIISLVVIVILSSLILGISFVPNQIVGLYHNLIKPAQTRLIQTVAENRQPYFNELAGSFGPYIKGVPLGFWMFFIGSIVLFYDLARNFAKKERYVLTGGYVILLISIFFSRYSASSKLNGEDFTSIAFYGLGVLIFISIVGFYYLRHYKENKPDGFGNTDFGIILIFVFFLLAVISARGVIRLILVLAIPASILLGYLAGTAFYYAKNSWKKDNRLIALIVGGIVLIAIAFCAYEMYKASESAARGYIPSGYNFQWQKAMQWVRENTSENAVFGHWWDYGYWIQSIGNRATVLDGGNSVSYWNHLMGRYGLTEPTSEGSVEFLYAHNTTHFLIDSSDIGKYSAFSTIGSNESYDRQSWIPTLAKDKSQTVERKNSTLYVYPGGASLDEDIVYDNNGSEIFLPKGKAGLGAIVVEVDANQKVQSVLGVFVYQSNQYSLPLRYYYDKELVDLGKGLDAGVFLMPRLNLDNSAQGQGNIEDKGSLLYLSRRTVHSQLARLYLFDEQNDFFKLKHTQSDPLIEDLKSQGIDPGEFVDFRGFRGPIKIWEIHYPKDIKFKKEFTDTVYPESLRIA